MIVKPQDATRVNANAIVRVFIGHGDRTDRTKARLKYLLDRWGLPKCLEAVEQELGHPLIRIDGAAILPPAPIEKHGHIGVHAQKQQGLSYIGVVCPVGRLTGERLRGLADIAERFGSGTIRLTVWQNCLISDVANEQLKDALAAIQAIALELAGQRYPWRHGGLHRQRGVQILRVQYQKRRRDADIDS